MAWDEDGNECDVLSKFEGGFVVQYVLETDEEPQLSSPTIVNAVYDTPPTPRRMAVAAELDASIKQKRDELNAISKELREAELRNKELLKVLSSNKALERVADFIAGKITHYVLRSYSRYSITPVKDTKSEYDSKNFRLLSLFGGSNGDLSWQLHKYSDASGSRHNDEECWPCMSEDEANEMARKMIREEISKIRPGGLITDSLYESAKRFDVEVPVEFNRQRLEIKKANANRTVQARIVELDREQKNLDAIQSELDAIGKSVT